jgi:hypothetical protein
MKPLQTTIALVDRAMPRKITGLVSIGACILTIALMFFASPSGANAQNLIQNPGFENNPPPNMGNNIPWPIPPWIVGTGQQPNVVKVDGPGGYNYGQLGPESDATAPGSGIAQHYLDIANGTNNFYQSFTIPSCPAAPAGTGATVKFGGYFSGRANAGGTATIQLLQGNGLTGPVIQTITGVVVPGNSKTDPWINVNGTATLAYGSTFSYVVGMPDPMNFDNATLTIDTNLCPGVPTTPVIDGCLTGSTVAITCNGDGTYTVTLSGVTFTGTDITMTSQTAGVTVTPPQQPWAATTSWVITGATPSQTVALAVNATNTGQGGAPGSDSCCSGVITVVIPDCPKQAGQVIVEKKVKNNTLVFPIGLSCTAPSNLSVSFNLNNGGSHTENNVPYTSVCTVTESTSTLPAVPKDACGKGSTAVWATPVITPASATINSPVTTVTVVNELDCVKAGSLVVEKKVRYDGPVSLPSLIYPVTVTCGSTVTNLNLVNGVPQTVSNIPLNTSCSVVEGTVPTPPNICKPPLTPVWSTVYVPPSPVIITGTTTTMEIVNTLTCRQVRACPPPQVLGPADQCVCPAGTVLEGTECVKQNACPPPMVPGPAAGQCICPIGTVLVGRECVKQITCQPPMVPGPVPGQCICRPGTVPKGKECVPQIECRSPLVPNAAGTDCVCRPGLVQKGRTCVEPVVCNPPAKLNGRGNACVCPDNMVAKGNSCVERPRPQISPGDIIRNIPGGGRGGRDDDGPRGGGRGNDGPRGGGGQGPMDFPGRR